MVEVTYLPLNIKLNKEKRNNNKNFYKNTFRGDKNFLPYNISFVIPRKLRSIQYCLKNLQITLSDEY